MKGYSTSKTKHSPTPQLKNSGQMTCSYCSYKALPCSYKSRSAEEKVERKIKKVCNPDGLIQLDDIICSNSDCPCDADRSCVSFVLGCVKTYKGGSRKRCIGATTIKKRFQMCAIDHNLTAQTTINMANDWIHYNDMTGKCTSGDCLAIKNFHNCNMMLCGHLVVAWKEKDSYNFVVSGSKSSDLSAAYFQFKASHELATTHSPRFCKSITSTKVQDCYTLKSRSHVDTICNEYYLQYDSALSMKQENYSLASLDWGPWCMVLSSAVTAILAALMAGVSYYRYRKLTSGEVKAASMSHETKHSRLNENCTNASNNTQIHT
uniref:Uncharacterized protein AlNc14C111G6397 n=1 Tax=Albugo laibachii Nc14 TaxID=890382 RepID=F0WIJ7_9STRA|nr:conserved hypothetical protein [Albugo laibachii Nc14]|eukprot:CCA21079.1 conserved hypothetical protein [Albugo laibachii Nc14]